MKIQISILCLILLFLGSSCDFAADESTGTEEQVQDTPKVALPDQESWETTIILTRNGHKVAEVWSNYIARYKGKSKSFLKDSIHVDFFNRRGEHDAVLTANEGEVDETTDNLTAIGNVIVITNDGKRLETETLIWDNREQKIVSHVPVKFTTATDTLFGDSFVSNPDMTNYEIENPRGYSGNVVPVDK